jgi:hypothetical protein
VSGRLKPKARYVISGACQLNRAMLSVLDRHVALHGVNA